jgi:hypothetical protein
MRRLVVLGLILAILAGAWAGGWFWLASWAERNVETALSELARRGIAVSCPGRQVVGFPFALKVACGETEVSETRSGSEARLAGVTAGASIFAPMTATAELASPARLDAPLLPASGDFTWQAAALHVGVGMGGPRDVAFDTTGLNGQVALPDQPPLNLAAGRAAGRLAPSEDGGSLAEASFTALAATIGGTTYPAVDGHAAALLSVPPRMLLAGRGGLQPPLSLRGLDVLIASGEARLGVTGELSVDAEGVVDGTLTLRLSGAEALPAVIASLPPEQHKEANAVVGGLMAFGRPATLDGKPASELVLEIKRGKVQVGPVSVDLPRLPL